MRLTSWLGLLMLVACSAPNIAGTELPAGNGADHDAAVGGDATGGDAAGGDTVGGDPIDGDGAVGDPAGGDPFDGDAAAGDPIGADGEMGDGGVEAACDGGVPSGSDQSRVRHAAAVVPFGQTCATETQTRLCTNGLFGPWSGSYTEPSCSVAAAADCLGPDGASIAHGAGQDYFSTSSVPHGAGCQSETRTCDNGTLGGSHTHPACLVCSGAACAQATCDGLVCDSVGSWCYGGTCCAPSWQNSGSCGCAPTACGGCTGLQPQADGCGGTRQVACSLPAGGCSTACCNDVGIWYSPWYSRQGNYIWARGTGAGSTRQFVGDVNGDGWADAIMYWAASAGWYVALSVPNGEAFSGGGSLWFTGLAGATDYFFADVTGDDAADLVAYFDSTGFWYVAASSGAAFSAPTLWAIHPAGAGLLPLVGDVNNDGLADGVIVNPGPGHWYLGPSAGTAFAFPNLTMDPPTLASWGGGSEFLLGDTTGDGRADAVVFVSGTGSWYVSASTGTTFTRNDTPWITNVGVGSAQRFLADADGDARKDATFVSVVPAGYVVGTALNWHAALSNGSAFTVAQVNPGDGMAAGAWKRLHGTGGARPLVGKLFGTTSSADAPTVFEPTLAQWRVLEGDRYSAPEVKNFWEFYDIRYVPRTLGTFRQYDSGEPAVIDEHLEMIANAGIDFIIFDLTNGLHVAENYLFDRSLAVCERIAQRRLLGLPSPRFAVAIGQYQYSNDPAFVEIEAAEVWNQFLREPRCGGSTIATNGVYNPNYMHVDVGGEPKPLLVSYAVYQARRKWECWLAAPPLLDAAGNAVTAVSPNFWVRFTGGDISDELPVGDFPCATYSFPPAYSPADVGFMPPHAEWGSYMGWVFLDGPHANPDVMNISPGWDIRWKGVPGYVSRAGGATYTTNGWGPTLTQVPRLVVINSFNEFAERTGIQPADTSDLANTHYTPAADPWPSADYYWDATVDYVSQFKTLGSP